MTDRKVCLDGPAVNRVRDSLAELGVTLPSTAAEWKKWWPQRDVHRADHLHDRKSLIITDELARTDPRSFFDQVVRPTGSNRISALRREGKVITSDEGIENELTDYLGRVADNSNPPKGNHKRPRANKVPKLRGMMSPCKEEEMLSIARSIDNGSGASHDGVSPGLLKVVLMSTWEDMSEKDEEDRRAELIHEKFVNEEYWEGDNAR